MRERIRRLGAFAIENRFTQIAAPDVLMNGPHDRWLSIDVETAKLREVVPPEIGIVYSLSLPMRVFRDPKVREQIVAQLLQVPIDALWLKIENFGSDA